MANDVSTSRNLDSELPSGIFALDLFSALDRINRRHRAHVVHFTLSSTNLFYLELILLRIGETHLRL